MNPSLKDQMYGLKKLIRYDVVRFDQPHSAHVYQWMMYVARGSFNSAKQSRTDQFRYEIAFYKWENQESWSNPGMDWRQDECWSVLLPMTQEYMPDYHEEIINNDLTWRDILEILGERIEKAIELAESVQEYWESKARHEMNLMRGYRR